MWMPVGTSEFNRSYISTRSALATTVWLERSFDSTPIKQLSRYMKKLVRQGYER